MHRTGDGAQELDDVGRRKGGRRAAEPWHCRVYWLTWGAECAADDAHDADDADDAVLMRDGQAGAASGGNGGRRGVQRYQQRSLSAVCATERRSLEELCHDVTVRWMRLWDRMQPWSG